MDNSEVLSAFEPFSTPEERMAALNEAGFSDEALAGIKAADEGLNSLRYAMKLITSAGAGPEQAAAWMQSPIGDKNPNNIPIRMLAKDPELVINGIKKMFIDPVGEASQPETEPADAQPAKPEDKPDKASEKTSFIFLPADMTTKLVEMLAIAEKGGIPTDKKELVAALIAANTSDEDELAAMVLDYRDSLEHIQSPDEIERARTASLLELSMKPSLSRQDFYTVADADMEYEYTRRSAGRAWNMVSRIYAARFFTGRDVSFELPSTMTDNPLEFKEVPPKKIYESINRYAKRLDGLSSDSLLRFMEFLDTKIEAAGGLENLRLPKDSGPGTVKFLRTVSAFLEPSGPA